MQRLATMRSLLATGVLFALLTPAQGRGGDTAADAIQSYLEACEVYGWSGVVLVEQRGKELVHAGFGLADRASGRRNDEDTLFELASITKPITAAAILSLTDDGKLDLDDSIAEHLPGVPDSAKGITVRHLLAHTSGMPRSATDGRGDDLEAAVKAYLGKGPLVAPGSKFEYWNGGYALLAGIIEEVSGKPYTDVLRKRVFAPAKMKQSGFTGDDVPANRQAIGYEEGKASRLATEHPYGSYGWHYRGMGGVVTTAGDLGRFVASLLDGDLLEHKTLGEMVKHTKGTYGLGWHSRWSFGNGYQISHGGDVRGFHSHVQAFQDGTLTIVVLSNVSGVPPWSLVGNIAALAQDEELPHPFLHEPAFWKERDLKALAGTWESSDGRRVNLEVEGVGLIARAEGPERVLLQSGALGAGPARRGFVPTGKQELHAHSWSGKELAPSITLSGKPRGAKALLLAGVNGESVRLERAP